MTEAEWLAATDPEKMLVFLRGRTTGRKMQSFAAVCHRRAWRLLADDQSRKGVEALEALASGEPVGNQGLHLTEDGQFMILFQGATVFGMTGSTEADHAVQLAINSVDVISIAEAEVAGHGNKEDVLRAYPPLVQEVFGNPFRPVILHPSWLNSTVLALADGIYTDRAFDRLPVLADALQDAGCDNEDILTHCRSEGPHVRGCWVIDLVLAKS